MDENIEKIRILWIIPYFFIPQDTGSKLRVWNLYKNLSKKFEIFIISFYEKKKENQPFYNSKEPFFIFGRDFFIKGGKITKMIYSIFSPNPLYIGNFKVKEAEEKIRELINKYNFIIIQADEIYTSQYLFVAPNLKKILILHNVDSLFFWRSFLHHPNVLRKTFFLLQFLKMRRYEKKIIPKVDKVFCVSEHDRKIFEKVFKDKIKFDILPNGVDTIEIKPLPYQDNLNLIFVGAMRYYPNIMAVKWFIEKIYPLILKEYPESFFYIIGKDFPKKLKKYQEKYPLKFLGYVPNLKEYYEKSKITVIPLKIGSGTRLKILESMAFGKPVVSTSLGVEGLKVKDMENILIADNPKEFAEKVILLNKDKILYEKIKINARKFVEENYEWGKISKILEKAYYELTSS